MYGGRWRYVCASANKQKEKKKKAKNRVSRSGPATVIDYRVKYGGFRAELPSHHRRRNCYCRQSCVATYARQQRVSAHEQQISRANTARPRSGFRWVFVIRNIYIYIHINNVLLLFIDNGGRPIYLDRTAYFTVGGPRRGHRLHVSHGFFFNTFKPFVQFTIFYDNYTRPTPPPHFLFAFPVGRCPARDKMSAILFFSQDHFEFFIKSVRKYPNVVW